VRTKERPKSARSTRMPAGIIPLADCHGLSERGRLRKLNEDDFRVAALPIDAHLRLNDDPSGQHLTPTPGQTGFLFLVADGMGGLPCGDRASGITVRSFTEALTREARHPEQGRLDVLRAMRRGILQCRSDLQAEVSNRPECSRMGSTLTGFLSLGRRVHVVHSGDSRAYMLRGSTLSQVTSDHSQAQLEIDAGYREPDAARMTAASNSLWNCISSHYSDMSPDYFALRLEPGDRFLLCTDGISDVLPASDIRRHLSGGASAESICSSLVAAARGGIKGDDLTAVVARFGSTA